MNHALFAVSDTSVECAEFGPDMFVNLIINVANKGKFKIYFVNDNNDDLLTVEPDYTKSVRTSWVNPQATHCLGLHAYMYRCPRESL